MYAAFFRALPGPVWLRIIIVLLLLAGIVAALFTWVFPWVAENFIDIETTVDGAPSPISGALSTLGGAS